MGNKKQRKGEKQETDRPFLIHSCDNPSLVIDLHKYYHINLVASLVN